MGFINTYTPENYAVVFDCPDGENQLKIAGARLAQTKETGKQMIEVAYKVKDCPGFYYDRFVEGDNFNKFITKFFDTFKIPRGNFDFATWKDHYGKGFFAHEDSQYINAYGETKVSHKAVLKYLIVEGDAAPTAPAKTVPVAGMTTAAQVTAPTAPAVPEASKPAADDGFPEDIPF